MMKNIISKLVGFILIFLMFFLFKPLGAHAYADLNIPSSLEGCFLGKKFILTSIGQGSDIDVFQNVLDYAGMVEDVDFVMNKQVKASDVQ
jgi:hypothetical protein